MTESQTHTTPRGSMDPKTTRHGVDLGCAALANQPVIQIQLVAHLGELRCMKLRWAPRRLSRFGGRAASCHRSLLKHAQAAMSRHLSGSVTAKCATHCSWFFTQANVSRGTERYGILFQSLASPVTLLVCRHLSGTHSCAYAQH